MKTKKVILFSIIIILLLLLTFIIVTHYTENKKVINDVRNIGVVNEYVEICYTDINSCEIREIMSDNKW